MNYDTAPAGLRLWFILCCMLFRLLLIAVVAPGAACVAQQQPRPNFLFIFVDDQSWSGTSIEMLPGNPLSRTAGFRMPNLEGMASRGMVFSQAYASHPKCECSRAALLMGRSTTSLNAVDKSARNWSAPASHSLANTLKRAEGAYRAAHFGKWQWPQTPQSMGYDVSDGVTMNADGDSADPLDPKQSFGLTRRAASWMQQQVQAGHPFYLQVSFYAPHSKPQALAETLQKYSNPSDSSRSGQRNAASPLMAAMTEDLDTCIGVLLNRLSTLGIGDNTYVIYMSDNGGATQLLKGGKGLVDEGGIRVPLIVEGPGIAAGSYSQTPVVGYDILPTVLDLACPGSLLPEGVEGGSWRSVLHGGGRGEVVRPIPRLVFHHDVEVPHPQTAMRKGDLKLVYYWDTKQAFLYDLASDLSERRNLADERPQLVPELLGELKAHVLAGLGAQKVAALESGQATDGGRGGGVPRGGGVKGGAKKGGVGKGGGARGGQPQTRGRAAE